MQPERPPATRSRTVRAGLRIFLGLARVWMGGSTALAAGVLAGSVIAIIGIWQLTVGSHDGARTLLLLAATTGGLTMALRSWWRLRVRRSARGSTLPHA